MKRDKLQCGFFTLTGSRPDVPFDEFGQNIIRSIVSMHTVYLLVWSFVFVLGNIPCSQIEAELKLVESSAFDISCVTTSICMVTD